MKVAVIGSRKVFVNHLERYLPPQTTELVSGGAYGVDSCAKAYAMATGIPIKEFLPDYETYGRRAPIIRNTEIIDYADIVIAFWDGTSRGTKFVIERCRKLKKPLRVLVTPNAMKRIKKI